MLQIGIIILFISRNFDTNVIAGFICTIACLSILFVKAFCFQIIDK